MEETTVGRIYAIEDTGRRFLARIKCDYCGASIKPNPDIARSGWKKWGTFRPFGDGSDEEFYCCPDCTGNIPCDSIETSDDYLQMLERDYPHLNNKEKP
jgi:hypothetical protein